MGGTVSIFSQRVHSIPIFNGRRSFIGKPSHAGELELVSIWAAMHDGTRLLLLEFAAASVLPVVEEAGRQKKFRSMF
jgi:hypothetical protein